MAAEIGNNYAEKWTVEEARALAKKALSVISDDCFYLSEVAVACDSYRDVFEYLLKKFPDDREVFSTIKRMQSKCESIIARKTGEGEIVPSLGIFILKAYHRLTETSNLNIQGEMTTTTRQKLDPETAKKISDDLEDEV